MNPLRYRPKVDPLTGLMHAEQTDWEDNWVSNFMAWASEATGLDKSHWPVRLTNWMWTDCPTCLAMRGIAVGFILGAATVAAVL